MGSNPAVPTEKHQLRGASEITPEPFFDLEIRWGAKRGATTGRPTPTRRTEHRVGDPCAPADHRPELMPVHLTGDRRGGVPAQIGDRLHGHPAVTHDPDERVTQLARRLELPDPRLPGDEPERPPHVRRVQRTPGRRAEHQPAIAPRLPRLEPLGGPVRVMPGAEHPPPAAGVPASDTTSRSWCRREPAPTATHGWRRCRGRSRPWPPAAVPADTSAYVTTWMIDPALSLGEPASPDMPTYALGSLASLLVRWSLRAKTPASSSTQRHARLSVRNRLLSV